MITESSKTAADVTPFAPRISDAPIGAANEKHSKRWMMILVVFMRLAAVLWLARGILHWATIVGIFDAGFVDLRLSRQGAVIALAVLDLVAAVGMWLTSSWGVAVWLIVLTGEALLPILMPDIEAHALSTALPVALACLYIFLAWRAAREEHGG